MRLEQFDIEQACSGYPDNDQLKFRFERCCIVALIDHLLKKSHVPTNDTRKVFLRLEPRTAPGLLDSGEALRVNRISWPFDCARYFTANGEQRSAMLADASERALVELAKRRKWSVPAIREIFAKVRDADYKLHADRVKACRSPDGSKRARVTYYVDRDEFRIDVTVTGAKRVILLHKTILRAPPTHGLCVHSS